MSAREVARRAARAAARLGAQSVGARDLPLMGMKPAKDLLLLNGDALAVRGHARFSPRPSLYGTSFLAEPAVNIWQAAQFLALPSGRLVRNAPVLAGGSLADLEREGHMASLIAAEAATAAAVLAMGGPVTMTGQGAKVLAVVQGSPAAAAFEPGDVVVSAQGRPVRTAEDMTAAAFTVLPAGGVLDLEVLRPTDGSVGDSDGHPLRVRLDPPPLADGSRPLGVRMVTHRPRMDMPLDVELRLPADCVGPSLGLMLALAIVDVCTPGELTGGVKVAGTGTVDVHGRVGEIGGVELKARCVARRGLRHMLVPVGQGSDAQSAAGQGVAVHEVGTVEGALAVLAGLTSTAD